MWTAYEFIWDDSVLVSQKALTDSRAAYLYIDVSNRAAWQTLAQPALLQHVTETIQGLRLSPDATLRIGLFFNQVALLPLHLPVARPHRRQAMLEHMEQLAMTNYLSDESLRQLELDVIEASPLLQWQWLRFMARAVESQHRRLQAPPYKLRVETLSVYRGIGPGVWPNVRDYQEALEVTARRLLSVYPDHIKRILPLLEKRFDIENPLRCIAARVLAQLIMDTPALGMIDRCSFWADGRLPASAAAFDDLEAGTIRNAVGGSTFTAPVLASSIDQAAADLAEQLYQCNSRDPDHNLPTANPRHLKPGDVRFIWLVDAPHALAVLMGALAARAARGGRMHWKAPVKVCYVSVRDSDRNIVYVDAGAFYNRVPLEAKKMRIDRSPAVCVRVWCMIAGMACVDRVLATAMWNLAGLFEPVHASGELALPNIQHWLHGAWAHAVMPNAYLPAKFQELYSGVDLEVLLHYYALERPDAPLGPLLEAFPRTLRVDDCFFARWNSALHEQHHAEFAVVRYLPRDHTGGMYLVGKAATMDEFYRIKQVDDETLAACFAQPHTGPRIYLDLRPNQTSNLRAFAVSVASFLKNETDHVTLF